MRILSARSYTAGLLVALLALPAFAQTAGKPGKADLVIADRGATQAVIVVSPEAAAPARAGEKQAAADLAKFIGLMSGATPRVADTPEAVAAALKSQDPLLIVGEEALAADPSLKQTLEKVAKQDPFVRADAIAVRRSGSRVLLAGNNDESHYYAAAYLLRLWGCRWYLPTEIGEAIPAHATLKVGDLDYAYGPPFEMRGYWISWNGSGEGADEFRMRNFMNAVSVAGGGHALAAYTGDLAPPGKSSFDVPFAEPATAEHVANKLVPTFQENAASVSVAIEDGVYESDSTRDKELVANIKDKYFQKPLMTDPMMVFYGNLAKLMREKVPGARTTMGGLAYVNVTIPPQWKVDVLPSEVIWLAPIDIDPIHGMDDPRSPPRHEYREMMHRWADVMDGRLAIYDYDQGMLVWRDIPNPSHMAFRQDVKHYRDAGILGIKTESRNAIATTFLNLHLRGQLMWDPDADVGAMLAEFYPKFYGAAAEPMGRYWGAIFKAWEDTLVTEHEFYAAPAIYTPALIEQLRKDLAAAERAVAPLAARAEATRNEKLVLERMRFARLGFDVLDNYMAMVRAAATDGDYGAAVAAGEKGLAARDALTAMNPTFTTTRLEQGWAWWTGEVQQYRELSAYTDGSKGKLLARLPLEWAFHRDPNETGLPRGWAYREADLTFWNAHARDYPLEKRKDYPTTEWEVLRTDLYAQAQGVLHPDHQSFTGFMWYKTPVELKPEQVAGRVYIRFPGLFSEAWLYVNGYLVAHREQNHMWWHNDYRFEWDVDLTGKLGAGKNDLTLRVHNTHHNGGMFRRPFLYQPIDGTAGAAE